MAIWKSAANADGDKRDYSILNPAWRGGGALIYESTIFQKFNLWIPNRDSIEAQKVLRLIENRYGQYGRYYVEVTGKLTL